MEIPYLTGKALTKPVIHAVCTQAHSHEHATIAKQCLLLKEEIEQCPYSCLDPAHTPY